jgi:hypothetical protein
MAPSAWTRWALQRQRDAHRGIEEAGREIAVAARTTARARIGVEREARCEAPSPDLLEVPDTRARRAS